MTGNPLVLGSDCSVNDECPEITRARKEWLEVTGYQLDANGARLEGEPELTVEIPDRLIPGLADLEVDNLSDWIEARHRADHLRIQTLTVYGNPAEQDDYRRYVSGEPFVMSEQRRDWLDKLRADKAAGKLRRNLHIVREPLDDYLRYQFEWGYTALASADMDLRVLTVDDSPAAEHLLHLGDYAVVEHRHVIKYQYDEGIYVGATEAGSDEARAYAALGELAWEQGTPFATWWASRPQCHRAARAA